MCRFVWLDLVFFTLELNISRNVGTQHSLGRKEAAEIAERKWILRSVCIGEYLQGQCGCFGAFGMILLMFFGMVIKREFLATLNGLNPGSNIA